MQKGFLIAGCLLAALAVVLGAFGAHGLKKMVDADTVATFQTGVQYQMYHSLALLAVGIIAGRFSGNWIKWAGLCFIAGILLFSGSLYLLTALKTTEQAGWKGVGIITPVGGIFFVAGWLFLFLGIMKKAD